MANGDLYPERICAFVDILGFRDYVAGLGNSASKVFVLIQALQRVHKPLFPGVSDLRDIQYRTQSISDAVAISVVPTVEGLIELFSVLQELSLNLLSEGYFIRGAIARGRLHHDDAMVFGEALIKAYDLEAQIVRYPRIMVVSNVVDVAKGADPLAVARRNRLRYSDDGPLYLHILQRMQQEMSEAVLGADNEETDRYGAYGQMKSMIEKRYKEAVDNPRHFEKVQWFARYWNATLPYNAASFRILGPGL